MKNSPLICIPNLLVNQIVINLKCIQQSSPTGLLKPKTNNFFLNKSNIELPPLLANSFFLKVKFKNKIR